MAKKMSALQKAKPSSEGAAPLAVPNDYPGLLSALKSRIQTARVQAHLAVNRELIRLYWDIGRMIVGRQEIEGWGKAVVERLSTDLCTAFPEMKGLSLSNLWRMRSFFLAYSRLPEILAQAARELDEASQTAEVLAQLARDSDVSPILRQAVAEFEQGSVPEVLLAIPWFHNVVLVEKLKDSEIRLWYAAKAAEHAWSRAVLVHQIESDLHLRAATQSSGARQGIDFDKDTPHAVPKRISGAVPKNIMAGPATPCRRCGELSEEVAA
jgi:predicted nuclease of restriction endonuclease-like (RecB) superfamily